ncbi:MAG: Na+/H+ antiporter subunit E [Chromatocurvus sp.]
MTALQRVLLLALLWWILTEGVVASWFIGVPAILLATLVSVRIAPPAGISLVEMLLFLPVFLTRSFLAAFDVARRTLSPSLDIHPGLLIYRCVLPEGPGRVVFMNIISLLPGTLAASQDGATLTVHVLDCRTDHNAQLAALESRVQRIFPGKGHG